MKKNTKLNRIQKIKKKHLIIRKKIIGTSTIPRLCIYKSNKAVVCQIIDDSQHHTLAYERVQNKNLAAFLIIATKICQQAKRKKISHVIFDRSGYLYIGKIKAFVEKCREEGLKI